MKFYNLKCKNCGAMLQIDPERNQAYCQYCGAKLLIDDETLKIQTRIVDDARIKEAEAKYKEIELNHELRLTESEQTEKQRKEWNLYFRIWGCVLILLVVLNILDVGSIAPMHWTIWGIGGLIYFNKTKPGSKKR